MTQPEGAVDSPGAAANARAVLEARARRLAQRPAELDDDTDALEMLVVHVSGDRLGIPLANVVAIARAGSIAPLPRAVSPVHGVTAWRGRTITVLSLGALPPAPSADRRLVVLGAGARAALALVVDAVDDVVRTPGRGLSPPGDGPRRRYARGVTTDGLLVVDGDALLHPETLPA